MEFADGFFAEEDFHSSEDPAHDGGDIDEEFLAEEFGVDDCERVDDLSSFSWVGEEVGWQWEMYLLTRSANIRVHAEEADV